MNRQPLSDIDVDLLDHAKWPTIDLESVSIEERARIIRYRDAIIAFIGGMPRKLVASTHGISRNGLNRMFRRCLKVHSDGRLWGFRALRGYVRQKKYERKWSNPNNKKPAAAGEFA